MTDDNEKSINRRHFLVSASTIALAGCTSLGGSDLPPPNYDETPEQNQDDSDDTDDQQDEFDDPPEDQRPIELSEEEENFMADYRVAHTRGEEGMSLLGDALTQLRNREFEDADNTVTEAQIELWAAREVVLRQEKKQKDGSTKLEEPEMWKIADNITEKTDLNLDSILSNMEIAITMALAAATLTRNANTARDNGEVETYKKQRGEAQIKLNNAEFYLPMSPNDLRNAYLSDLKESGDSSN